MITFKVIDGETGLEPNLVQLEEIVNRDQERNTVNAWSWDLVPCDLEGFTVAQNGELFLLDECGHYARPPEGRFRIEKGNTKG